jgi:hypothetical protein
MERPGCTHTPALGTECVPVPRCSLGCTPRQRQKTMAPRIQHVPLTALADEVRPTRELMLAPTQQAEQSKASIMSQQIPEPRWSSTKVWTSPPSFHKKLSVVTMQSASLVALTEQKSALRAHNYSNDCKTFCAMFATILPTMVSPQEIISDRTPVISASGKKCHAC